MKRKTTIFKTIALAAAMLGGQVLLMRRRLTFGISLNLNGQQIFLQDIILLKEVVPLLKMLLVICQRLSTLMQHTQLLILLIIMH